MEIVYEQQDTGNDENNQTNGNDNNKDFTTSDGINNNDACRGGNSEIEEFYNGGCVFITGGTGFIGKALTEKLLRTCTSLQKIYLLIRPKNGYTAKLRCDHFLNNPVFDRIRSEPNSCQILSKVVGINGDVTKPELGISHEDQEVLQRDVTVVFNSAATVKFNESLKTAVSINTIGTQRICHFCRKISSLKAFVHISTAYSNADKEEIMEMVYPIQDILCTKTDDRLVDETLSESTFIDIGTKLQPKHPNTYTVTKAVAECVVAENTHMRSIAIVRPSIVTAAWREPYRGWVDNANGITGIMMEIGRGTIRSAICNQNLVVDIIPVDFVVNTLIAAAWHTFKYRPNNIRVYNCTSGASNPLRWEELGALIKCHAINVPSSYVQWYPGLTFRTNRFIHLLYEKLFHFFPAFVIDTIYKLSGSKPIMLKLYQKLKLAAATGEFFALHQWNFACENIRLLEEHIECVRDQKNFYINISELDWDCYIMNYMLGIRTYVMKDSLDSVPSAKKKLLRLYWLHKFVQAVAVILIYKCVRN